MVAASLCAVGLGAIVLLEALEKYVATVEQFAIAYSVFTGAVFLLLLGMAWRWRTAPTPCLSMRIGSYSRHLLHLFVPSALCTAISWMIQRKFTDQDVALFNSMRYTGATTLDMDFRMWDSWTIFLLVGLIGFLVHVLSFCDMVLVCTRFAGSEREVCSPTDRVQHTEASAPSRGSLRFVSRRRPIANARGNKGGEWDGHYNDDS